jgi:hypothetical protein
MTNAIKAVDDIIQSLDENGFFILKKFINPDELEEIRSFWVKFYRELVSAENKLLWDPYLGHPNLIAHTSNYFNNVFRTYDFKWNAPIHAQTRRLLDSLEPLRRDIIQKTQKVTISDSSYYYSSSHYPPSGEGFMAKHNDGIGSGGKLIHILVPLTFYGIDYTTGGQYVINRIGEKINTDMLLSPCDVIIYDGCVFHGVDNVSGSKDKSIGRIQIFSIPNEFTAPDKNQEFLRNLPIKSFYDAKITLLKSNLFKKLKNKPFFRS